MVSGSSICKQNHWTLQKAFFLSLMTGVVSSSGKAMLSLKSRSFLKGWAGASAFCLHLSTVNIFSAGLFFFFREEKMLHVFFCMYFSEQFLNARSTNVTEREQSQLCQLPSTIFYMLLFPCKLSTALVAAPWFPLPPTSDTY